ncbi:hypothetical protein ABE488_14475 [Luteimonas sp. TWI662]|uniref:hypothetical protein n=1 Tax=Luteimonas sp. TWI662 TaxID=3136789 RepID=UPI0032096283
MFAPIRPTRRFHDIRDTMKTAFSPVDMPRLPRVQREAAPCAQQAVRRDLSGHIFD